MSPAWNEATDTCTRSVSNRTGTSNSKPAVTRAPGPGGSAKVTTPVAQSTVQCSVSTSGTPFTPTRTLPATGFTIGRR